jgi:hypothetical protein
MSSGIIRYLECFDNVSLVEVEDFGPNPFIQVAHQLPARAHFYTELQRQQTERHIHTETQRHTLDGSQGWCMRPDDRHASTEAEFINV